MSRQKSDPNEQQDADTEASAAAEAQSLFSLVGRNGDTIETIRELIAVPEETEAALQALARACPQEQANIKRVLRFRREVQAEFERLLQHMPCNRCREEAARTSPLVTARPGCARS